MSDNIARNMFSS